MFIKTYRTKILMFLVFFIYVFTSAQVSYVKGKISDKFGSLPGANVEIEGTEVRTQSELEGEFFLKHIPGTFNLNIEYLMYGDYHESITLIENDTLVLNIKMEPGFVVDEETTLGTRAKGRTSLETVLPVDIISQKEISNATQVELGQFLHFISPTFNSTHQTISDGTDHIDPATIHGLGPDQLLVLINGKRRHSSSLVNVNGTIGRGSVGTDFNAIPLSAVERIEILRNGATSHYGSDAIAGVVNVILKNQTGIITLKTLNSVTNEGGGKSNYVSANVGFDVSKNGFVNVSAEYRSREAVNRAGDYTGPIFNDSDNTSENRRLFFEQTGLEGQRILEIGSAASRNINLQFNSEFEVNDRAAIYAFGGRNYREGQSRGFYRRPFEEDKVVLSLFPFGFLPEIGTDIQDDAITLGIKGDKNNWDIDFSHSIGVNSLEFTIENTNNASLGEESPTIFDAGGFLYNQHVTNLDFSKNYDYLKGVNVAFGAQLRIENYQIIAGEEASFKDGGNTFINEAGDEVNRNVGAQVFPGFRPENELSRFRTNSSGYIDVEAKLTEEWLAALSARIENYNDFKSEITWRSALRYLFNENLSFRTSYSTGFRAPSLHQLYFNNTSIQFVEDGTQFDVGTFNNFSAVAEALGINRLSPEISKHIGLGLTAKIFNKFSVSADYYNIRIYDRIVLSNQIDEGFEELLNKFGLQRAQFFTNAIDTRTNGVDFKVNFNNKIGAGNLQSTLSANFSKTKIKGAIRSTEVLEANNQEIFNREERSRIESLQPRFKMVFLNTFEYDKFIFQVNNSFFGSSKYVHPDDGDSSNWVLNEYNGRVESRDQTFSPKVITDTAITYRINDFIHLSVGANNALNVFPDKHKHFANTSNGSILYSRRVQQFGVKGASYFGKLVLNL